ncbi:Putative aliphatic sulfonates transport permease protein SsuC [Pigmentiphaga humi]|uniref:Aliphatic sulfonates transport permease protein SsuC n=1 Tax=Pigmentiphaga humi TaxID=2478468 RepID=A0A3P4B6B1_9BURK|nr:ABC transporter permease [Pigmentiphaga humi]VCU71130.1 Putative aliphatic sulfonates transport permease protein SsuC [Pigmentiphaga humi]
MNRGRRFPSWIGAIPILLLLAGWQGLAMSGRVTPNQLPSLLDVAARFAEQMASPDFLADVGVTLLRLFAGFFIALVLGVGLGLAGARTRAGKAIVTPLVRVLGPIPKVALYPAFILLLGFDHASKIALVVADAAFPILLATLHGAGTVEPKLIWSALAAGTPRSRIATSVVLPAAMPSILTGCRIGLVISCVVVFLAEMITSTDGLGHQLVIASRSFITIDMFVALIAISLLGLVLNFLLGQARRFFLRGFPEES